MHSQPKPWMWMEAQSLEQAVDQAPAVLPPSLSQGCAQCLAQILDQRHKQDKPGEAMEFQLLDPCSFPSFLRPGSSRGWD